MGGSLVGRLGHLLGERRRRPNLLWVRCPPLLLKRWLMTLDNTRVRKAEHWITLAKSAELVGVSRATLRRWAEREQVYSFRTPGGHRRFAVEDLQALTASGVPESIRSAYESFSKLALATIRGTTKSSRRRRSGRPASSVVNGINRDFSFAQETALLLGDSLFSRRRHQILRRARTIGFNYGRRRLTEDHGLERALESFTLIHRCYAEALADLAREEEVEADVLSEIWESLRNLSDEILLGLGHAYQVTRQPSARESAAS